MHSFHHRETNVSIHYNSDYSGEAIVSFIVGENGFAPELEYVVTNPEGLELGGKHYPYGTQRVSLRIPAKALADFSKDATVSRVISLLEGGIE